MQGAASTLWTLWTLLITMRVAVGTAQKPPNALRSPVEGGDAETINLSQFKP